MDNELPYFGTIPPPPDQVYDCCSDKGYTTVTDENIEWYWFYSKKRAETHKYGRVNIAEWMEVEGYTWQGLCNLDYGKIQPDNYCVNNTFVHQDVLCSLLAMCSSNASCNAGPVGPPPKQFGMKIPGNCPSGVGGATEHDDFTNGLVFEDFEPVKGMASGYGQGIPIPNFQFPPWEIYFWFKEAVPALLKEEEIFTAKMNRLFPEEEYANEFTEQGPACRAFATRLQGKWYASKDLGMFEGWEGRLYSTLTKGHWMFGINKIGDPRCVWVCDNYQGEPRPLYWRGMITPPIVYPISRDDQISFYDYLNPFKRKTPKGKK